MKYIFNGKTINIPDEEIKNNMKLLDITEQEAIGMWLDDNEFTENEEVEELTKKAKENKTDKIKADKRPRKPREQTRKENPTKERIIAEIAKSLHNIAGISNIKVVNIGKIIEFECEGHSFKVDLVQKRKSKT